jgi:glucan phosphoethanolaminetransferase (alkaline phosphatase superfamily)
MEAAGVHSAAGTASRCAWLALLVAPSITVFAPVNAWDIPPLQAMGVTLWALAALWGVLGPRFFYVATYPLALFGAVAMAGDFARHVNVLELLLLGAHDPREMAAALRPYAVSLAGLALALAVPVWAALRWRHPVRRRRGLWMATAAIATGALAFWAFGPGAMARAWPLNVVTVGVAQWGGRSDLVAATLPFALVDPRDPSASWHAHRLAGAAAPTETYVLVVGESVRADRLQACGGRSGLAPSTDTLVFCDVMASSSSTHTSVPLLVSRELPGAPARVSRDATFLRAFAEAGFRTAWLSVQERSIAWPDAQVQAYLPLHGTDRASLLPAVQRLLRDAPPRQLLVVHPYNAHFAYCDRADPANLLVPIDCRQLGSLPSRATRPAWLAAYDNAVHESLLFLDAVIRAADARGGEVFVLYVPDHGENLLDDDRELFQHALTEPTHWDTRVPMIVHANQAWRDRHPAQWQRLAANRAARVMHADVVPTLLGAAGIGYDEPRTNVADLTAVTPGPRKRLVLRHLGETTDGDLL